MNHPTAEHAVDESAPSAEQPNSQPTSQSGCDERAYATDPAEDPSQPRPDTGYSHPSSHYLTEALAELRRRLDVATQRGLNDTEILEVAEDLAHTLDNAGWMLVNNHGTLQHAAPAAVTEPLLKAAEALSRLGDDLFKAHGEYTVDDHTFPSTAPLRDAMEEAHLAASSSAIGMTQQQSAEVTGRLLDIIDVVTKTGEVIAGQSQPQGGRWWQITRILADAASALRDYTHEPTPDRPQTPTLRAGQHHQAYKRDVPPLVGGSTGSMR